MQPDGQERSENRKRAMPILTTPATRQAAARPFQADGVHRRFMICLKVTFVMITRRIVRPREEKVTAWNVLSLSSRRTWHDSSHDIGSDIDPVCECKRHKWDWATARKIVSLGAEAWLRCRQRTGGEGLD